MSLGISTSPACIFTRSCTFEAFGNGFVLVAVESQHGHDTKKKNKNRDWAERSHCRVRGKKKITQRQCHLHSETVVYFMIVSWIPNRGNICQEPDIPLPTLSTLGTKQASAPKRRC
jgi:hypothetical protein